MSFPFHHFCSPSTLNPVPNIDSLHQLLFTNSSNRGAFTTHLTWRWCFYINLPVGGVVAVIILFVLDSRPSKNKDTIRQQIRKLDPLGTLFFLPGIVCLLLALQWGGSEYHWYVLDKLSSSFAYLGSRRLSKMYFVHM